MLTFNTEQDQYLQLAQTRAYYQGLREGIQMYAHWHDGEQYVGTTGRTLQTALAGIHQEEQEVIARFSCSTL